MLGDPPGKPSPRSLMPVSTQVRLARRPEGEPGDDTYAFEEHELPELVDGQLLLRVVYLSLDPYMRGRMSAAPSYAAPVEVGDVMVGGTVCVVEESRAPGVRRRRHGALLLRLADARDQRRHGAAPAGPLRRTRLHRTRGARHARLHGVRRTARDRQAATGRDRRRRRGHRPGRVGGRPDREGQGRPRRRHRGWRREAAGPARRVRLRRRAGPPLPHVRGRPRGGRARTGSTSTSRTSAGRSRARCSSG